MNLNEQIKKMKKAMGLNESVFKFNALTPAEQQKIFDIFEKSYKSSTGTSWDRNKFISRAQNWLFYGDTEGFVTVRPQNSGFYKLTGVAGNPKSILEGFNELYVESKPVWGMVSQDIQKMALKKGFKTPPAILINILFKMIPKSVLGGVDFDLNNDGSLTLKYSDVGDSKKYFIANDEYYDKLKRDIIPTLKDKLDQLPSMTKKAINLFLNEEQEKKN